MIQLQITPGICATSLTKKDAPELFATMEENRDHLDCWSRGSPTLRSEKDVVVFLNRFEDLEAHERGFFLGIREGKRLIGGVVCWDTDRRNRVSEVGYWLTEAAVGRGVATRAIRMTIDFLFRKRGMNRIEM